jgi:RNA ligase (TIGR02306 family)
MSNFEVPVLRVDSVLDNPNADRLNVVKILGFDCISNKLDDGSPRYREGDYVAYVPEGAILPEWLLKKMGMWNHEKNKGGLNGSKGDRVKAIMLRGVLSQGVMIPLKKEFGDLYLENENLDLIKVTPGQDVMSILEITKYIPEIPNHMAGEVLSLFGYTKKFDFESIQKVKDIFMEGVDEVVVTEKIHGTHFTAGYIPDVGNEELFGKNKNIFVSSKGMSSQGLVFKNNEANENNLYVRILNEMLSKHLEEKISDLFPLSKVHFFGEVYGPKIQGEFSYGEQKPTIRMIAISVDWKFLDYDDFVELCNKLNVKMVPLLYRGPYNKDKIVELRDGQTTLNGKNIREGVVIQTVKEEKHDLYGRKIAKWVSPNYLKKDNLTEYQ